MAYTLKRQYGKPIAVVRSTSSVTDFLTGKQSTTDILVRLTAAVVPGDMLRKWSHMDPDTARKQDFAFGGTHDLDILGFIMEARDLGTFTIDLNCWVSLGSDVYRPKTIKNYQDEVIGVLAEKLEGSNRVFIQSVNDKVPIGEA